MFRSEFRNSEGRHAGSRDPSSTQRSLQDAGSAIETVEVSPQMIHAREMDDMRSV